MKKKIILLGVLVFALAIIGSVSAQETGGATTGSTPALSTNIISPPNISAEPVAKELDLSNIDKQQKLDRVISKGLTLINVRVSSLKVLAKRISKNPKLNDEQKKCLVAINDQINSLQALATKLKAETDIKLAKADVKSIYTDYRIYGVFIPKINLIQTIETEQNYFNALDTYFTQTQARINQQASSSCLNIAAKQKALDNARALAVGIDTALAGALEKVSALIPADYSATSTNVIKETNKITKEVRKKFVNIRILLIKANTKAVSACTKMQVCTDNQCVDKCPDHTCSRVGQKGCTESGQVWFCVRNEIGCIVPKNSTCAGEKVCKNGNCVAPACTAFTYIDWTTCSANGSQSRKVASSSPAGCIGGNPILTQICTFIPTCQSTCDPATYTNQCNTTGISGYTECSKKLDGCYYPVGKLCPPGQPCSEGKCVAPTCTNFTYTVWAACNSDSSQLRKVVISLPLGCTGGNPVLTQKCTYVPPVPTCTDFTYSDWTACSILGLQTRKVTSSSSTGCTGGNPVLTQKCTYVPSCQSTCDPAAYGTQCTAARANGYTECSKKLDGCYSPAEKLCPLGQTCSDGKCSVPCLAQGRNSSNLLAACCEGLAKKTDYYLNINYLYTCCLPTQCAKNGVCVDNGSTIPVAGSTIVPTCVDGEWVRKAIS